LEGNITNIPKVAGCPHFWRVSGRRYSIVEGLQALGVDTGGSEGEALADFGKKLGAIAFHGLLGDTPQDHGPEAFHSAMDWLFQLATIKNHY